MLNLTPKSTNNLIIYADTVNAGGATGAYFTMLFTNAYSKQTFAVVPNIVRRNSRFVELEIELVNYDQADDRANGIIYLYPEGNFDYLVFNTTTPTLNVGSQFTCDTWPSDEAFWQYWTTHWTTCAGTATEIDRGQAFLYSDLSCDREIEFVAYQSDNNFLESIVYVTGIPQVQFPCTIESGTTWTVTENTVTYCDPITIENSGTLIINNNVFLKQLLSDYEQC
jgi:hypothetical protein